MTDLQTFLSCFAVAVVVAALCVIAGTSPAVTAAIIACVIAGIASSVTARRKRAR